MDNATKNKMKELFSLAEDEPAKEQDCRCLCCFNRVKQKKMCGWRNIDGYRVATVAAELENAGSSEFPNTWEWIGGIDKLR